MMENFFNSISETEWSILDLLHNTFAGIPEGIISAAGIILGIVVWAVIGVAMLFVKRKRTTGISLLIACSITVLLTKVLISHLVIRIRPMMVLDPSLLNPEHIRSSFPSTHTAVVSTAAGVFLIYDKRIAVAACLCAVIVAVSRLIVYAHYPTDVLAGAILGTVVGTVTGMAVNQFGKKSSGKRLQLNGMTK